MTLKDQCCTESQGKRLEELGITAKPLFCYCWVSTGPEDSVKDILLVDDKNTRIPELATTWIAPAYTVSELSVMLPVNMSISKGNHKYHCRWWRGNMSDMVLRDQEGSPTIHRTESAETLAIACASMLIYLLENKLATAEEVNNRLNQ
jgi:hypothetical protein